VIRESIKPGFYCVYCGGNHMAGDHAKIMAGSKAPLETPSHNGIYRGTVEVRQVAPGASGDLTAPYLARVKAAKANRKQVVSRMERKVQCAWCKRTVKARLDRYCSPRCRSRYNYEKSKARPKKTKDRKLKWSE
jgi:hypothetical protein